MGDNSIYSIVADTLTVGTIAEPVAKCTTPDEPVSSVELGFDEVNDYVELCIVQDGSKVIGEVDLFELGEESQNKPLKEFAFLSTRTNLFP